MSFLRICPSEQRVFHHLVRQLRKPDIKLIHSLVSCRYRGEEIWQGNIQLSIPIHHPACLRIDTLICLFPSVLVLIMAIYSRAVTWTMCYSEHTFVGFFFKVQFISETRVNATSFCLNHRSMTSTCKFQSLNFLFNRLKSYCHFEMKMILFTIRLNKLCIVIAHLYT